MGTSVSKIILIGFAVLITGAVTALTAFIFFEKQAEAIDKAVLYNTASSTTDLYARGFCATPGTSEEPNYVTYDRPNDKYVLHCAVGIGNNIKYFY